MSTKYQPKPLTAERLQGARDIIEYVRSSGLIPWRAFYYFVDLVAEVERLRAIVRKQEQRINDYSWRVSPDKSGGAYTDEEILRYRDNSW